MSIRDIQYQIEELQSRLKAAEERMQDIVENGLPLPKSEARCIPVNEETVRVIQGDVGVDLNHEDIVTIYHSFVIDDHGPEVAVPVMEREQEPPVELQPMSNRDAMMNWASPAPQNRVIANTAHATKYRPSATRGKSTQRVDSIEEFYQLLSSSKEEGSDMYVRLNVGPDITSARQHSNPETQSEAKSLYRALKRARKSRKFILEAIDRQDKYTPAFRFITHIGGEHATGS